MLIQAGAQTDLGMKRMLNEDSFLAEIDSGLFVVADGMGGHAAGEVASAMAVETIKEFVDFALVNEDITWPFELDEDLDDEANMLKTAVRLANQKIYQKALEQRRLEGMGTTIVTCLIRGTRAYIAHVGDSRAYLIRDNQILPLTADHSWVNVQVQLGTIPAELAKNHPMKNIITRALGTREDVEVDLIAKEMRDGDRLVLCSDGLSTHAADNEILELADRGEGDLDKITQALVNLANERGGEDNITVVVLALELEEGEESREVNEDTTTLRLSTLEAEVAEVDETVAALISSPPLEEDEEIEETLDGEEDSSAQVATLPNQPIPDEVDSWAPPDAPGQDSEDAPNHDGTEEIPDPDTGAEDTGQSSGAAPVDAPAEPGGGAPDDDPDSTSKLVADGTAGPPPSPDDVPASP